MENEINTKKMIRKLISITISIILLTVLMALDILKIEVIKSSYIIAAIVISAIFSGFALIFKYHSFSKKAKYYYYQVLDFLLMLNIALIFIQIIFIVAFFPATVYKSSMYPTLKELDNLIVQSLGKPKHGDIVVLKVDEKVNELFGGVVDDELIVKRVIGLPGDTLYYDDNGYLHLNGEKVVENYLLDENGNFQTDHAIYNAFTNPFTLEEYATIGGDKVCTPNEECKIPEDYYFVLGDNRGSSIDSRYLGLFHKSQIIGIAKYKQTGLFSWDKL